MNTTISSSWKSVLTPELQKSYYWPLMDSINSEYSQYSCFPHKENIFRALDLTDFEDIKVVILGQDPYHTPGAAMWLSFSIPTWSPIQPSLRNIFKELESDLWIKRENTDLTDWAKQWVLLLNSVLSVREGEPASHVALGWEIFTDAIIRTISEKREWIVFVLWGKYASQKSELIDSKKHLIITSPHPSPFSAYRWFFGSRPFSQINEFLEKNTKTEIIWN